MAVQMDSKGADSTKDSRVPPVSRLIKYELKDGKNIRAGFTMESDPGEPFEWNTSAKVSISPRPY